MPRLLCLVLVLLLAGCSSLPETPPAQRSFLLTLPADAEFSAGERRPGVLLVDSNAGNSAYDQRRMAYRHNPHEIRYYAASQWASSPAEMLRAAVVESLEPAALTETVLQREGYVRHDYRLELQLLRLSHEYAETPMRGELVVAARLLRRGAEVLAADRFQASSPAEGEGPAAGVQAQSRALRAVIEELLVFLDENLPRELPKDRYGD
ncbi:ABC-type transport auxiliary lipoprotein family protein [Alkalilimnicola sp. S0819]|uniref:ABC-type transport auxiliary lipoprotein family protein n=1 Tax=Alkalilimnicola sp. S0819 TaxID=2613922 RepID=UPI001261F8C8|nr:ABC-type transport auxiliary lipoprotein family protein [Alkalilimnicola sp. S0819]KAB7627215.1 hypothetical protein F3N43_04705 [Alkalilimnicola sp. S0819]MPQ15928.1 hypothetical protein [Alkalilimnicola sp. S0819]